MGTKKLIKTNSNLQTDKNKKSYIPFKKKPYNNYYFNAIILLRILTNSFAPVQKFRRCYLTNYVLY